MSKVRSVASATVVEVDEDEEAPPLLNQETYWSTNNTTVTVVQDLEVYNGPPPQGPYWPTQAGNSSGTPLVHEVYWATEPENESDIPFPEDGCWSTHNLTANEMQETESGTPSPEGEYWSRQESNKDEGAESERPLDDLYIPRYTILANGRVGIDADSDFMADTVRE